MPSTGPSSTGPEWIDTPASKAIDGFGYSSKRRELEIRFKHGETYVYLNVPQRVFMELYAAPSRGQFVAEVVKRYNFEKR